MSDNEDDCVTFGTALEPLDEDNLPRKKPISIEEQIATDECGRRRFHGAFTGGFSAGYFNSVGSRDGWRPQQFVSSRSSKASNHVQRPEDFMDEEDTGEYGFAPSVIRTTQQYSDETNKGVKRERTKTDSTGPIPGTPVLKEILKPVKERVGVLLLKKMGWKPGQGIGPRLTKKEKKQKNKSQGKGKVYGCSLPNQEEKMITSQSESSDDDEAHANITFAPDDYEPFRCDPKDNYFGIGYSGLDRRPILSQHLNLFDAPSSLQIQEKNKKLSIRGQAFGVGAFEAEDDDIYARDDMSRYDFTIEPERKTKSKWSKGDKSKPDCIEGFVPAKEQLAGKKCFPAPELPKDFKPVHKVRKSRFSPAAGEDTNRRQRHHMTAETRAQIINDERPSIIEGKKSDPKNSSVAAKMISHALNLHGKEQIAEREKFEQSIPKKTNMSWLDKLSATAFVKGETLGLDPNLQGKLHDSSSFAKATTSTTQPTSSNEETNQSRPSFADLNKQRRFEQYLNLSEGERKFKFSSFQPLSMTEWERDQEVLEFEKAAKICEALDNNDVGEKDEVKPEVKIDFDGMSEDERMMTAAKMNMYGKLTRTDVEWKPAKIVCIRFNVAEPDIGVASEDTKKKKKFSIFDASVWEEMSRFEKQKQEESEPGPSTSSRFSFMDEEPDLRLKRIQESPARRKSKSTSDRTKSRESSHDSRKSNKRNEKKVPEKEKSPEEDSYENMISKKINEKSSTTSVVTSESNEIIESSTSKEEPTANMNAQEKKDLFKSIFLSSDESESEAEESADNDKLKAALMGTKDAAALNVERNTSPPRGIFAKLNFDDLFKKPDKTEISKDPDKQEDEVEKREDTEDKKEEEEEEGDEEKEEESPVDTYGPALPGEVQPSIETLRPVFTLSKKEDGTWVEKSRDKKKSKKEKKKHKHKERSKSKSRKKKEKKEKRH